MTAKGSMKYQDKHHMHVQVRDNTSKVKWHRCRMRPYKRSFKCIDRCLPAYAGSLATALSWSHKFILLKFHSRCSSLPDPPVCVCVCVLVRRFRFQAVVRYGTGATAHCNLHVWPALNFSDTPPQPQNARCFSLRRATQAKNAPGAHSTPATLLARLPCKRFHHSVGSAISRKGSSATRLPYASRWKLLSDWCRRHHVDPEGCPPTGTTLAPAVTAQQGPFLPWPKGSMSLPSLLGTPSSAQFELLGCSSYKTTFLLAIASAKQVGKLFFLSVADECLRWSWAKMGRGYHVAQPHLPAQGALSLPREPDHVPGSLFLRARTGGTTAKYDHVWSCISYLFDTTSGSHPEFIEPLLHR